MRKSKSMDELAHGEDERYSLAEMTSSPDANLPVAEKSERSVSPPPDANELCAVLDSNANDKSDFVTSRNIKSSSEESRIEKQALLNLMAMGK